MSANPDSVAGQGEFHDSIKPSKPMTTKGHQIGQPVGPSAHIPEYHAHTFPPGTAPKSTPPTFQPNTQSSVPGQALNDDMDPSLRTGPLDMPGATSRDVYNASAEARPVQGQTSQELHGAHLGSNKNKKERSGLQGVAPASDMHGSVEDMARAKGADLPEGVERGVSSGMAHKSEGGRASDERRVTG